MCKLKMTNNQCKCCDGVLHPENVVSVYKGCGLVRLIVLHQARKEVIYIDNLINYCPMCGRNLKEADDGND